MENELLFLKKQKEIYNTCCVFVDMLVNEKKIVSNSKDIVFRCTLFVDPIVNNSVKIQINFTIKDNYNFIILKSWREFRKWFSQEVNSVQGEVIITKIEKVLLNSIDDSKIKNIEAKEIAENIIIYGAQCKIVKINNVIQHYVMPFTTLRVRNLPYNKSLMLGEYDFINVDKINDWKMNLQKYIVYQNGETLMTKVQ